MPPDFWENPLDYFNDRPPQSVVSLVPSWTASLTDLGLSRILIGVTDYCPFSGSMAASRVKRIGPPKGPNVEKIIALHPDLVIANQEENDRPSIEALQAAGIPVWLTFPKTIRAMISDLWTASSLFRSETAPYQLDVLEKSVEWAELALEGHPPVSYFCPIWQDRLESGDLWWMTFNQDTYSNDVLRVLGGKNLFAARQRRYPLEADLGQIDAEEPGQRDIRYPRVTMTEIIESKPEVIILPDEPFSYSEIDLQEIQRIFSQTPAGLSRRIYLVKGDLLHWPGTIVSSTLEECSFLFDSHE